MDLLEQLPIWYIVFLFSTVCHEAAHALVAKLGGDDTAYAGGQVSLDPIPHIRREPFGLVLVPILSFYLFHGMIGWGSAPMNPYWQIRHPRRAALMALAGPGANITLAICAAAFIRIGLNTGIFAINLQGTGTTFLTGQGGYIEGIALFLSVLFLLNILLAVFNLLPIPPLDGYTVLGLFLPEELAVRLIEFARSPGLSLIGILVAWQFFPHIIMPVFQWAIRLLFWGL